MRHPWKCVSAILIASTTTTVVLYRHCTNSVLLLWLSAFQWYFALQLYFALQRCFHCQLWYSCRSIFCRILVVVVVFQVFWFSPDFLFWHVSVAFRSFSMDPGPSFCVTSIGLLYDFTGYNIAIIFMCLYCSRFYWSAIFF